MRYILGPSRLLKYLRLQMENIDNTLDKNVDSFRYTVYVRAEPTRKVPLIMPTTREDSLSSQTTNLLDTAEALDHIFLGPKREDSLESR